MQNCQTWKLLKYIHSNKGLTKLGLLLCWKWVMTLKTGVYTRLKYLVWHSKPWCRFQSGVFNSPVSNSAVFIYSDFGLYIRKWRNFALIESSVQCTDVFFSKTKMCVLPGIDVVVELNRPGCLRMWTNSDKLSSIYKGVH